MNEYLQAERERLLRHADAIHLFGKLTLMCCTMLGSLLLATVTAAKPPNVVLILADDMAIGDLSSINGGISKTPRLDALASESLIFTNAYAGAPVCAPSRAAFLTGRYPHRTGSVTLNQEKHPQLTRIRLDETLVAERFQANGYATGIVGKWHSGPGKDYEPRRRGFDEAVVFHDATEVKTYYRYQLDRNGTVRHYHDEGYLTDVLTEHAIDFVRRHHQRPFFLHLAHYAPHRPLSAAADLVDTYRARGLDEKIAKVYAMIEVMDTGIGAFLDELDALGLRENTLVIFASDNGPDPLVGPRWNLPYRGTKYTVNEGGIRVPLFVCWPGTVQPGTRAEPVHFIDLVPSLIEICELQRGPVGLPLDGVSFAGMLSHRFPHSAQPVRRYWQWNRVEPDSTHNAAVREGDWKLVKPFVTSGEPKAPSDLAYRLYKLSDDPGEHVDLRHEYPELVERLSRHYTVWFRDVEADRTRAPASREGGVGTGR